MKRQPLADTSGRHTGVAIAATALVALGLFGACTSASNNAATKPAAKAVEQVKPAAPALDLNRTSYQGQLMTDYQVGKVLGEIKCGKRPAQEGMDLLNVNGVPPVLLTNQTPELVKGYANVAQSWDCG